MVTQGTVRNVVDHQYGSELDGDHAAGATSLTVIWTNDFNADGGQLYFADPDTGEITEGPLDYTIPTEDPSDPNNDTPSETDIDLATPLANSYVSGDKVWVYPKKVERWAYFMEPNGSKPLPARVRHNLRPLLPLGGRTDDTAEQVLIEEEGTDQVVIDVLAEPPVQDLNSVLLTTSPDGTGQRVEIDQDGIREYEPDGTTVGVELSEAMGLDLLAAGGGVGFGTFPLRKVRWVTSAGDELAYLTTQYSATTPTLMLAVRSILSAAIANAQIEARSEDDTKFAQLVLSALNGADGIAKATVSQAGGGSIAKTIIKGDGTSDFVLDTSDGWQNWTPTFTGWSANPASGIYRYKQIGKLVHVVIRQPNTGTSNATTLSISAPVTAATITNMRWGAEAAGIDNGVNLATPSRASIDSGASTINFAKDYSTNTGGWTAAGNKGIRTCYLVYEAA